MAGNVDFHHIDSPAVGAADAAVALELLQAWLVDAFAGKSEAQEFVGGALRSITTWLDATSAVAPLAAQPAPSTPLLEGLDQARHWAGPWLRRRGVEVELGALSGSVCLEASQWLRLALRLLECLGRHADLSRHWRLEVAPCAAEEGHCAIDLWALTIPMEAAEDAVTISGGDEVRPLQARAGLRDALETLVDPFGGSVDPLTAAPPEDNASAGNEPSPPESSNMAGGWRLRLPGTASTIPAPAAANPSPIPPASNHVLLYVEDDPINLLLVQELAALRPTVTLHTAPDGHTGLARAAELRPALIFVDLHLPDIDGFEVLARLRAVSALADVPVLALSASTMPGMIERALLAGFVDYWRKPINAERFLAGLDAWLARLSPGSTS